MSTPDSTTPPAGQPTPEQVQQMGADAGTAAGEAIERGATPDEVRAIIDEKMTAFASNNQLQITDDQIGKLVDGIVGQFERMGAFDRETPPAGGDAAAANAAAAAAGLGGAGAAPAPPAAPADPSPRKRTFAERFLGDSGN